MPLIKINSVYRTSGTPEEYDFTLYRPIKQGSRLRLLEAVVPKTMYPVIAGYNDTVDCNLGAGATTVTLTANRTYSGVQLASELDTAMTLTAGDWTFDPTTNKLSCSSAASVTVLAQTTTPATAELIGASRTTSTTADPFTLPNQVDLSYPRYLELHVEIAEYKGHAIGDNRDRYAFIVPFATAEFGEIETWQWQDSYAQVDTMPDVHHEVLHITWKLPNDEATLSFNGVEHQLLFDITE